MAVSKYAWHVTTTKSGPRGVGVIPGPGGAEEAPVRLAPAREPEPSTEPDLPLRRNRDFGVVLVGQGISSFGDSITNTAVPILVLALTGSGFAMGIVGVLSTLPDLVVGLPAGAFADRWDRRRMMLLSDLGRAVLTAVIPLSVWLDGPTLAVVILVAFPMNVLRVVWLAAYTAAVPGLVGRAEVPRANAVFEAVFSVGWIVGPALAGFMAATIGPGPTIAIDAATFLLSAASLLLVRRSLRPEPREKQPHLVAEVREGVVFVIHHPTLRAILALWTSMEIVLAGLTSALIFYVTIDRGLGTQAVGLVLSAYAVGSLAGSAVAARAAWRAAGRAMLVGTAGIGLTLLVVIVEVPIAVLIGASLAAGVLSANVLVAYLSLRTLLSPDALLGRVGATARTVSIGLMPIGALVTGLLLDAVGGGATLVLMGATLVGVGLSFALVPVIRDARMPRTGSAGTVGG